jgi:hypothetical protein
MQFPASLGIGFWSFRMRAFTGCGHKSSALGRYLHNPDYAPQQAAFAVAQLFHILLEPVRDHVSDTRAILFKHHHVSIAV